MDSVKFKSILLFFLVDSSILNVTNLNISSEMIVEKEIVIIIVAVGGKKLEMWNPDYGPVN